MNIDECRMFVEVSWESEQVVTSLMTDIVHEATDLMESNHLDRLSIPYTVRCVTREMLDFINAAFLGQDNGHVRKEGWNPDAQAETITIDSWARSAVSVKIKPAKVDLAAEAKANRPPSTETTLTLTRRRAAPGGLTSNSSIVLNRHRSERAIAQAGLESTTSSKPVQTPLTTKTSRTKSVVEVETNNVEAEQELTPEEAEYLQIVKQEQRQRAEIKQLTEGLSKQMEELKGVRDFVVDAPTGKVVAVKELDKSILQAKKVDLRYAVSGQPAQASGFNAEERANKPIRGVAPPGQASVRRPRKDGSEFYQEEASYGPMVEPVIPAGGVVLKDGDVSRRMELKLPKSKVSRSEYRKMIEAMNIPEASEQVEEGESPNAPAGGALPLKKSDVPSAQTAHQPVTQHARIDLRPPVRGEFRSQQLAPLPKKAGSRPIPAPVATTRKHFEITKPLVQASSSPERVVMHQDIFNEMED